MLAYNCDTEEPKEKKHTDTQGKATQMEKSSIPSLGPNESFAGKTTGLATDTMMLPPLGVYVPVSLTMR